MRPHHHVVVERVVGVVAGPLAGDLEAFEGRHAMGQHRPYLGFEDVMVHGEVVVVDGWVHIRGAAAHVGVAVAAHVDAGGVDGERQSGLERLGCVEDEGVSLARLDRQGGTRHPGHFDRTRPCGIDERVAVNPVARGQDRRGHTPSRNVETDDLVGDVLHAVLAGLAAPPIEHRARVEVALVGQVVAAADDVVDVVEGVGGLDLGRVHDASPRPQLRLDGLVAPEYLGEALVACEIHVAEVVGEDVGDLGIAAEALAEVPHEVRAEAGDLHVERVRELLAHAAVRVRGGCIRIARVAFDHQHRAVEAVAGGQRPGDRRPHDRSADDDHVVGVTLRRVGGDRHWLRSCRVMRRLGAVRSWQPRTPEQE